MGTVMTGRGQNLDILVLLWISAKTWDKELNFECMVQTILNN